MQTTTGRPIIQLSDGELRRRGRTLAYRAAAERQLDEMPTAAHDYKPGELRELLLDAIVAVQQRIDDWNDPAALRCRLMELSEAV